LFFVRIADPIFFDTEAGAERLHVMQVAADTGRGTKAKWKIGKRILLEHAKGSLP
jgi:hypothetical protein